MKHAFIPLFLSFVLLASAPAMSAETITATQTQKPAAQQSAAPAQKETELGEIALIEVRKHQRRMFLLDAKNNVLHSYHVSLGWTAEGAKQQEGDGKTPEGKYTIDRRNGKSGYYRSLHISYPDKDDIARAKKKGVSPGGDIFIHGKPDFKFWMFWKYNKMNDWTDGCIAVDDKDMMEMWGIVKEGTPIVIKP